jgi:hypothetical protein
MISAKQLKGILDKSFSTEPILSFTPPSAILTASPDTYTTITVPASITFSSTIVVPGTLTLLSWDLKDELDNILTSGVTTNVSYVLNTPPSTVSTPTYNLVVYYSYEGTSYSIIFPATVIISVESLVGQLANPGDDITIPGDLTAPIEATLTSKTKLQVINLFAITAAVTGRIVLVVPDSYGTLLDIQDNTDSTVLSQFDLVLDPTNSRRIYVSISALTPATYNYKLVY